MSANLSPAASSSISQNPAHAHMAADGHAEPPAQDGPPRARAIRTTPRAVAGTAAGAGADAAGPPWSRERLSPAESARLALDDALASAADAGHWPRCHTFDSELWFGPPQQRERAVELCQDCPLLDPCGAYAVAAGETWGVWGGLDREHKRSGRRSA